MKITHTLSSILEQVLKLMKAEGKTKDNKVGSTLVLSTY